MRRVLLTKLIATGGIGAFVYRAKALAKHLFIILAVLAGVAVVVFVLSFFPPFIIPAIRTVGNGDSCGV
jgi:hypothetical protein